MTFASLHSILGIKIPSIAVRLQYHQHLCCSKPISSGPHGPKPVLKSKPPKEIVPIFAGHKSPHLASAAMLMVPPYQRLLTSFVEEDLQFSSSKRNWLMLNSLNWWPELNPLMSPEMKAHKQLC